jgi:hypothetical protein
MKDPKRWTDPDSGSSPKVRALLHAGRSEILDEERVEIVGARLGLWTGTAGGALHAGTALQAVGKSSGTAIGLKVGVVAKIGAALVVATAGAGTSYVLVRTSRQDAVVTVPSASVAASTTTVSPVAFPAPSQSPPSSSGTVPPTEMLVAPPTRAPTASASPAADTAAATIDSEVSLVAPAQDALTTNPQEALALAQRHAARFPHGTLEQEREVIAIEALLGLGRVDDAKARAARFFRSFPGSAHRARIENLLGGVHNP